MFLLLPVAAVAADGVCEVNVAPASVAAHGICDDNVAGLLLDCGLFFATGVFEHGRLVEWGGM